MSRSRRRAAGWLELTAAILRGVPKLRGALCADRPHTFDVDDGPDGERTRTAVGLCQRCDALPACAAWVDTLHRTRVPRGVTAGRYRARRGDIEDVVVGL